LHFRCYFIAFGHIFVTLIYIYFWQNSATWNICWLFPLVQKIQPRSLLTTKITHDWRQTKWHKHTHMLAPSIYSYTVSICYVTVYKLYMISLKNLATGIKIGYQYVHCVGSCYLRQGGYVIVVVCLLATLCKNFQMDLHDIFREGWQ